MAKRMTRSEWASKHPDFRAMIDGAPFVLSDEGAKGTCLVPVELVDDRALERADDDLHNLNTERFG